MKKLFFALVIGLLFIAALTTTALADNGPHGGTAFTSSGSMDACASCHRAHTAQTGNSTLLKASSIYGLCTSCHDGTGAYTDVVDGIYNTTTMSSATKTSLTNSFGSQEGLQGDAGAPLFGGGFVNTLEIHTDPGNRVYNPSLSVSSDPVVSGHLVDDRTAETPQNVWGSGNYNTTTQASTGGSNPTLALTCTSCHDPHGNAGQNGSGLAIPSYRILKYTPDGSNGYEITSAAGAALFTTALKPESGSDATSVPDIVGGSLGAYSATVLEPYGMGANSTDNYTATSHWYTLNTNNASGFDPFLVALYQGHGVTGTMPWTSVTFGPYDPVTAGLHGVSYQRPATTNSTKVYCFNPTTGPASNPPPTNSNCTTANGFTQIGASFDNSNARLGMAFFCSQCHDRYLNSRNGLTTNTTDLLFMFQHDSGAAPSAGSNPNVTCVDCHNAHGTSAAATTLASDPLSGVNGDSSILKLDNRAMCVNCHSGDVGFTLK
ncbi:MAG TPA: cytochrome c3 family protein [Anaerolineales bacterium]|nr:cytochrome c3 family protein [Anaerolineales bacterium]